MYLTSHSDGRTDRGQHRPAAGQADRGCGVLQHRQHRDLRVAQAQCLHFHQPATAQQTTPSIQGASATGSGCPRPDGPQDPLQGGRGDLCPTQDDRRAGVWPDQSGQMTGSLPVARPGKGQWRVAPDRHHPQPPQAAQGSTGRSLRAGATEGSPSLNQNQAFKSPGRSRWGRRVCETNS